MPMAGVFTPCSRRREVVSLSVSIEMTMIGPLTGAEARVFANPHRRQGVPARRETE
jgi:hypothetical protein